MTALEARAVTLRYGRRTVLDGVDLAVRDGDLVGLIGPNGAGKSSLLRLLAGLARPHAGTVELDGAALDAMRPQERARRIGYLAQGGRSAWSLPVGRLVALGRLPHRAPWQRPGPEDAAAVARALEACDLADLADRPVDALSGGEQARALLARALAGEPAVLLADEPVAGLDPRHQIQVMDVLAARAAAGRATVVVLHDLSLAARYCHRLYLLRAGRILAAGPAADVLVPGRLAEAFDIPMTVAEVAGQPVVIPGPSP